MTRPIVPPPSNLYYRVYFLSTDSRGLGTDRRGGWKPLAYIYILGFGSLRCDEPNGQLFQLHQPNTEELIMLGQLDVKYVPKFIDIPARLLP